MAARPARADPLRILIANWRDPKHPQSGGAETLLFEIARRWVASGHEVTWLTAGFRGAPRDDVLAGVRVVRVGDRLSVYAAAPFYFVRHLRGRFDAIVDSENGIPFFSPLWSRTPCVCVMHHVHKRVFERYLPRPLSYVFVWLELVVMPAVYRRSAFVAISESTRSEMARYRISSRPVPIVHCGVDAAESDVPKADRPTIVVLGRLKAYKRVEIVIAAFARVLERIPDARLIVVGDGDRRAALERTATEAGVARSTTFTGYVDERRKAELLGSAWVYASASAMEGWGISVIEAAAHGTPAVVTDSPGLREAVVDGESGIVVTPEGFARALARVLDDDGVRRRLAAGAAARAATFSWDSSAAALLEHLRDEIERVRAARARASVANVRRQWDRFGAVDPMWAIMSEPDKLGGHWNERAFFDTGRVEIEHVLGRCEGLARDGRALDFGCGIGRLSRPLSFAFARVTGVDIAPSMLAVARERHADRPNIDWVLNETNDLRVFDDATFSFVYSSIVLQHVPPAAALRYLHEFARVAEPGGTIVFQMPQARPYDVRRRLRNAAIRMLGRLPAPFVRAIFRRHYRNAAAETLAALPLEPMAMHGMNENRVRSALGRHGVRVVDVEYGEIAGGGWRSVTYYARKAASTRDQRASATVGHVANE